MDRLFSKTVDNLVALLGYRSERHKVLLSNLVNIDTPGYRPKDLVFKKELKGAMVEGAGVALSKTNPRHIGQMSDAGKGATEVVDSGEKVSLDTEMMNIAENQLMFNTTVELLARKFRSLKSVLQEVR